MKIALAFERTRMGLGVLLLVAITVSCTPGTKYSLFNNTNSDIVVTIDRQAYAIPRGNLGPLKNWHAGPVTIETVTQTWSYSYRLPAFYGLVVDGSYNEKAAGFSQPEFAARRIIIQVNSDGKIFVVPRSGVTPVSEDIVQPDGFPLRPSATIASPNRSFNADAPLRRAG